MLLCFVSSVTWAYKDVKQFGRFLPPMVEGYRRMCKWNKYLSSEENILVVLDFQEY